MKQYFSLLLLAFYFFLPGLLTAQQIIDSLTIALKNARHDTTRCNILNFMIEAESNDTIWPKYNEQLKTISEENLGKNPSLTLKKIYWKHLSTALNNIAYLEATNGRIPEAIKNYLKCTEIQKKLNDKKGIAASLSSIGNFYRIMSETTML